MAKQHYDVVIVGAGPAGATAAVLLAETGRSVVLIDRDSFPRKVPAAAWLSLRATPLLEKIGIDRKLLRESAFTDVTFHRADFSESARPKFSDTPGYLVDRSEFDNVLVERAKKAEARLIERQAAVDCQLQESSVAVALANGRTVEGRLLLLAAGRGTPLRDRIGIPGSSEAPIWTAQVDAPLPRKLAPKAPQVAVVLGLDKGGSFGLCCVGKERVSVSVNWFGDREHALPALVLLCQRAAEHGVIPVDLTKGARQAKVIRSPASGALDMETHVGKHTLIIGDAGGFVSAASNEGIYPAMWSAEIAAEVVNRALDSVHSQDVLMEFDSSWRMQMADYLRSPHTDIQFLLPLIFTNQPMADRMGAAFFWGENI